MALKMTAEEMAPFLDEVFPQVRGMFGIDRLDEDLLVMRLYQNERHLRPGGTVSGPAMFGLADVAAYAATMARIGRQALAVTTNCSSRLASTTTLSTSVSVAKQHPLLLPATR